MKTRLLAMGAFIYLSAALVACGGGGGGGGTPPTTSPTTPATNTPPPGTVVLNAASPTTTSLPAAGAYSGTITFPAGSGEIQISTSTTNGTGFVLDSKGARRVQTSSTPNPFGCVGSTPYAAPPRRVNVAPVHPIAAGDAFHYTGSLATTYTESAPCPQPTATSSASITLDVAAQAATQPAGATSDLRSTENDAFPTLTSTTYTDQYVSNAGGDFTEYELKQSDPNGNSSDTLFANPQILDKTPGASWSNNPAATITETLADGTHDTRTVASDGSYTDTETFPNNGSATISVNGAATGSTLNGGGTYNVAGASFVYGPPSGTSGQTMRNGLFYISLYAQTTVTTNGTPALSINVPSTVTGSVYLAALQTGGTWQTIAGPVTVANGVASFPSSSGQFTIQAGFSETIALFQNVTQPANTILLTINDGSSSKDRLFPQWFTPPGAGGSLISDSFVNNGSKTIDSHCATGSGIPTSGNQVVETHTQIDPVLGYTETRVTTTYNAAGYGAVCVTIGDTLKSYINYQDTTTLIDYQTQNGNPNSVDTLTEYLSMQSPSTAQMTRTQSVSPLAVAHAVAAIQLQRDLQRAQKVRVLHDNLTGNRGAAL